MQSLRTQFLCFLLLIWSSCFSGCGEKQELGNEYPQRPIKLIVPFGAGGGSDAFARILSKAIEDNNLLPQPIVIINVPGAGGTVGSRRLKNSRPDGYKLMQLHEGIVTSKYSGRVSYGPEAFEVIAAMGMSTMTICVGENSEYESLTDLMTAATERPDEVIFSANIGAPSQFAGLMLEKESPGSHFRYSQTGDGAKRFAGLQGGHTDVSAFSLAEYIQFKPSGLRALALLGTERDPDAQEIPTAIEQGYDVVHTNMQFWWAPKGTPQERLDVIAAVLQQAMQTEEVQTRLNQLNIRPVALEGKLARQELNERAETAASVSQRPTVQLPNFPLWIAGAVVALALLSFGFQSSETEPESLDDSPEVIVAYRTVLSPSWTVLAVLSLTTIYVALMQSELLTYRFSTFLYLACLGIVLTLFQRKLLMVMGILSIVMSLGLHYVFTHVFVIDLP